MSPGRGAPAAVSPRAPGAGAARDVEALPPPDTSGTFAFALERAISGRRSVREFAHTPLTPAELSQLLWATQGITDAEGHRAAPSAGALYPLELYVVTAAGLHRYEPAGHRLRRLSDRDLRRPLRGAALDQAMVSEAPAVFVFAAVMKRMSRKYGESRSPRYVHFEVGHAAQNMMLQAVALGLGTVAIGAFDDARVRGVLGLPRDHRPLYLVPVGRSRR